MPEGTSDLDALFEHRVDFAEPPTPETLDDLPPRRGLALLLGDDDVPIQLLPAADMRARVRNRIREDDADGPSRRVNLRTILRAVRYRLTHSPFETDLFYLRAVAALWPKTWPKLVAWKPPWFVHVEPGAAAPHFARTREVLADEGRYFGPFPDGKSADAFIAALQDGLDLCRDIQCLRRAPHAQPCAYAQMGRCRKVCDGTAPLSEYRQVVAAAADFAAGDRETIRAKLHERMQQAAAELAFERAAGLKKRLASLATLDEPVYAEVAPIGQFRFVMVQGGRGTRQARAFLIDRGVIDGPVVLDYPTRAEQLETVWERFAALRGPRARADRYQRYAMGLIGRAMYGSPRLRGLLLRAESVPDAPALGSAIDAARDVLGLTVPKPKPETPAKSK